MQSVCMIPSTEFVFQKSSVLTKLKQVFSKYNPRHSEIRGKQMKALLMCLMLTQYLY